MNISEHVIEAKLKNGSYGCITGNADFYHFLGKRLYISFDRLITDASLTTLEKMVAGRFYERPFILEIYSESGETSVMVCFIAEPKDPGCTLIHRKICSFTEYWTASCLPCFDRECQLICHILPHTQNAPRHYPCPSGKRDLTAPPQRHAPSAPSPSP